MALWDSPTALAMPRVLHWVAALGFSSRVLVTTSSTRASVIVRGAPGRGSSVSPSRRSSRKRFRHLPTVTVLMRSRAATALLSSPSAQARTILAREARRWVLVGRDAQVWSFCRSSSLRVSGGFGRPPLFVVLFKIELYHKFPWAARLAHVWGDPP